MTEIKWRYVAQLYIILLMNISMSYVYAQSDFAPGNVYKNVSHLTDPVQSFALYLPKAYDKSKQYPTIVFIDPFGEGYHPVQDYAVIAEKFGYILIGSNNSQNGYSWDKHRVSISAVLSQISRFSIDPKRVYTAGFSGGSLVASLAAFEHKIVSGVIGCGGGFPPIERPKDRKFDYIGFAGHDDFNLNGQMILDQKLSTLNVRHYLRLFDGWHEWPKPEVMEDAFLFFEFNSMRSGLIKKDINKFKILESKITEQIRTSIDKKKVLNHYHALSKLIYFTEGLFKIDVYKGNLDKLIKDANYIDANRQLQLEYESEDMQRRIINQAFFDKKPFDWWANYIDQLAAEIKNNSAERHKSKRLLSWLNLVLMLKSNEASANNSPNAACFKAIRSIIPLKYNELFLSTSRDQVKPCSLV